MILLESGAGNYVISNGRSYSYFAGNNYLGLAGHPQIREAAIRAVEKYGVNFAASRQTTGTSDLHLELEAALASFKERDDAVVFASGYQGNSILLESLRGEFSSLFIDKAAHASIIAAIPAGCDKVWYYDHCDAKHLSHLLEESGEPLPLVITDGVFALTGEIAPLDRIYEVVSRYNGILVVDDAHGTGVLGDGGRGTPEYFGLHGIKRIYQTETMSKALGGYGGFITGGSALTGMIRTRSATYQASTALPPPIAAAGIASVTLLRENPRLRLKLLDQASLVRKSVTELGYRTTSLATPIIPLLFDTPGEASALSLFLEEQGVIVPSIVYPAREVVHLVRIAVSVSHTYEQIEQLTVLLKKWKEKR